MRLGSALIPLLKNGWYYGQDINPGTIAFGEEVLREVGIPEQAPYTLFASDQFEFALLIGRCRLPLLIPSSAI